ncbi:hypothetical protein [Actinocorallia longicatena]|uniref:Cellulose synthase n=1 Tax=Actinocorallia longicatena TaxID=111803 RepID=A0ABP6Q4X6_9ACTN
MSDALLFTISLAITALGLFASWGAAKRRGTASGLRGAAWSLVPLGFYLTGLTEFLSDLVFSPVKWAGVVTLGAAGALYVVSGVKLRTPKEPRQARPGERPAVSRGQKPDANLGDDLGDIEEILRRRGIN